MNREDIIAMAEEAGAIHYWHLSNLERFAALVAAAEREKVAAWMIQRSYATGHGDATEDLLVELEWQVRESEREACAKVCEELLGWYEDDPGSSAANAIRARSNT